MRFGLVIYGDLDMVTGGFIYDKLVVDYLRRQGHQVEIISLPRHSYGLSLSHNYWPYLQERLKGNFDALIQDELVHPSLCRLNHRMKPSIPYPLVSLVHSLRSTEGQPGWQTPFYRFIERQYLQSADAFIFISRHTRELVEGLAGGGRPYTIAYPAGDRLGGMTPEEITSRISSPGPRHLLYLGAVIPRKCLHVLLQALARLKNGNWQLTVAGSLDTDKAYSRTIFRLISQLGLSQKITLPGVLRGGALLDCLRRSHILAVPSYMEGLALVYLEAMHFGLVPLASAGGAAGEVITPGKDGFLIPPLAVSYLADRIAELLEDNRKLLAMSLAARERIARHPSWEQTGTAIHVFLQSLSRSGTRPTR